jgi:DNA-binding response OmpR family regulator
MKKKILIAEDDSNIRSGLIDALEAEGHEAEGFPDGACAIAAFRRDKWDLLLLDLMMPEKSGYEVAREVRATGSEVPILMLTAKSEEIDKVLGFEMGTDDYVTKPFSVRELQARIKALLRRSSGQGTESEKVGESPANFSIGPVEVDARRYEMKAHGQTHSLTPRELKLLSLFRGRPGEALSRDYLLDHAWGIDYLGTTRTLDQHIAQLRKKVESDPSDPQFIITVHGVGYRWMDES